LGLDGEVVYPLEPLATADSVTLFTQRAIERRGSFAIDVDTAPIVEALCRSLDGLPLAIELAAARIKVLSVQEISRRLGDRFTLLADPTDRGPERHRTLRAAISWSYDLLFPDDQRGLWALSCFSDGAPLAAVEYVLGALGIPSTVALDVIARLVDRSLARLEVGARGAVRYRLLDSVRAFATDQLRTAGASDVAGRAHAQWFADAAVLATSGGRGIEQASHLALAKAERANIDAALSWAAANDPVLGLRITNGFGWLWVVLNDGVQGARRIRAALDAAERLAEPADRVAGMLFASWLEASAGNLERATADVDRATRLANSTGDSRLVALARWYRSFVLISQDRPREALIQLDDCRAVFHAFGARWEEGGSWLLSAYAHLALGQTVTGNTACQEALRLLRPIGDQWALAHAEGMLGTLASAGQRFSDAIDHLKRAATAAANLGSFSTEAYHLSNLGRIQQLSGDPQAALGTLNTAIDKGRAAGDLRLVAVARIRLGRVLRGLGQPESARSMILLARHWYDAYGGGEGALLADCILAALDAEDGIAGAAQRLITTLDSARQAPDHEIEVLSLDALARSHAEAGRISEARELIAAADQNMPSAGHLLSDLDRVDGHRARALINQS
jgi:tetratricopeptide (TPR) repeat protein